MTCLIYLYAYNIYVMCRNLNIFFMTGVRMRFRITCTNVSRLFSLNSYKIIVNDCFELLI